MKNYSQNNEQEVILKYFEGQTGQFLDIGANDGVTFSNVRALAELGWKGVFVEPSPKAFERLRTNYDGLKGFYFYNFAIADHNGKVFLQESGPLVSQDDVALVSTIHQKEMKRFIGATKYETVEVPCLRWKTFLNRISIKDFDFITIDVEGSEMDILPELDLTNTTMICIEFNGIQDLKRQYEQYLSGFNLIYTSSENLIYAR